MAKTELKASFCAKSFNAQTLNTNVTFCGVLCAAQDRVNKDRGIGYEK